MTRRMPDALHLQAGVELSRMITATPGPADPADPLPIPVLKLDSLLNDFICKKYLKVDKINHKLIFK